MRKYTPYDGYQFKHVKLGSVNTCNNQKLKFIEMFFPLPSFHNNLFLFSLFNIFLYFLKAKLISNIKVGILFHTGITFNN